MRITGSKMLAHIPFAHSSTRLQRTGSTGNVLSDMAPLFMCVNVQTGRQHSRRTESNNQRAKWPTTVSRSVVSKKRLMVRISLETCTRKKA